MSGAKNDLGQDKLGDFRVFSEKEDFWRFLSSAFQRKTFHCDEARGRRNVSRLETEDVSTFSLNEKICH